MNLAVKLWGDMEVNERNLPAEWPAEVIENVDPQNVPEGYTLMTCTELNEYKQQHIEAFNTWKSLYLTGPY
jgi:hypothetical protein